MNKTAKPTDHTGKSLISGDVSLVAGRFLLAGALLATPLAAGATDMNIDGTYTSFWQPTGPDISYLFAGFVLRQPNPALQDFSTFTVGAQINAGNAAGVNQSVWGTATEAWAFPGSRSMLTGIEATTVNMEPTNAESKVAFYATFKNRPDAAFDNPPADAMNVESQALRIEAQPGTGFEKGVVFAATSLHGSAASPRPVAIDLSEMSMADIQKIDVIRFPDGCAWVYLGRGMFKTRCEGDTP